MKKILLFNFVVNFVGVFPTKFLQFKKMSAMLMALVLVWSSISFSTASANEANRLWLTDTQAGKPALIRIHGQAGEKIQYAVTTPARKTVEKTVLLNDSGVYQTWFQDTQLAGEYRVKTSGGENSFTVSSGEVWPAASSFYLNDSTVFSGDKSSGSALLRDQFSNRVSGVPLQIVSRNNHRITCLNKCVSDKLGQIQFHFQVSQLGIDQLQFIHAETQQMLYQEYVGVIPRVNNANKSQLQEPSESATLSHQDFSGDTLPLLQTSSQWPDELFKDEGDVSSFLANEFSQGNNDALLPPLQNSASLIQNNSQAPVSQQIAEDKTLEEELELYTLNTQNESISTKTAEKLSTQGEASNGIQWKIAFSDPRESSEEKEEEVGKKLAANIAHDFYVYAINSQSGEIDTNARESGLQFKLLLEDREVKGVVLPNPRDMSPSDEGVLVYPLSLLLPPGGPYTLVLNNANTSPLAQVIFNTELGDLQQLNQTPVSISITEPTENQVFGLDNDNTVVNIVGVVSPKENTSVVLKKNDSVITRLTADEVTEGNFQFQQVLDAGENNFVVEAIYGPDGSRSQADVTVMADGDAPVVEKVEVSKESVLAGEEIEVLVIFDAAEKDVQNAEMILNKRSIVLTPQVNNDSQQLIYSSVFKAPQQAGTYQAELVVSDAVGNTLNEKSAFVLEVKPGLQELANIFFIPGAGSVKILFDAVPEAQVYQYTVESLDGETLTGEVQEPSIELTGLQEISYGAVITALGAGNELLSEETEIRFKPLAPSKKEESKPLLKTDTQNLKGAAPVLPKQTPSSGPEVYLIIVLSLVFLRGYSWMRKKTLEC